VLQQRAEGGKDIGKIRSVARFFLSRIDVLADQLLGHKITTGISDGEKPEPQNLLGNTGISYQRFRELFSEQAWKELA
jgi:hypothetical protein